MFKCDRCHRTTNPREKMVRYPIKYRDRIYQINDKFYRKKIITTYGKEIVKEIKICEECVNEIMSNKKIDEEG